MKLFTVGPVEMYQDQMNIGGQQVPYFRNEEFSEVVFDCKNKLKQLVNANQNDDVIILTASGTAAMEATIMNCFTQQDKVLIINGGTFGQRFTDICNVHKIPFIEIKLSDGEALTQEHLDNIDTKGLTGLLVNIHETSTGQLYDIEMLSHYCVSHDMVFVVDAISSMFADHFDFNKYHVDVAIVSSQKALALAPGISLVIVCERMIKDRINQIDSHIVYLDFKDHLKNGKRGQTPFTPAVRLIYELQNRLSYLLKIGIAQQIEQTKEIALDFRKKLKEINLNYPEYPISNAETVVIFPNNDADIVGDKLKNDYGYIINPNGGEKAKKMFRVAHIGNHSLSDNADLIDAIKIIMDNNK